MDVVFAVMPFADIGRPAIGVSLLKAAALRGGYSASVQYCNVDLGDLMGLDLYQKISSGFPPDLLVGEWFFADDLFGDDIPSDADYLEKILANHVTQETVEALWKARRSRTEYLDASARRIHELAPAIVGFTTTFHQTCASLAVARRLKAMPDPPIILFGGANCEGEMGLQLLKSFPYIDYICCGESDLSFPRLLDHLLRGATGDVPGVLKQGASTEPVHSDAIQNMDSLPYPDYDDYFDQLGRSKIGIGAAAHVIVETSRGCWWGAKHHCTFCGLNGETMAFRSKSAGRAYEEIVYLCEKHGYSKVGCVDNILDMRYIDTLFPNLAASGLKLDIFYEVKANLRYEQLVKMHRGGLRQIQPGIESFSNEVLRLMNKGVTGFQNIQLMRWCEEIGIGCDWNLLAGFPRESPAEYEKMAELVPLLTHLNPPCSCAEIRLDRFSPFHSRAADFGFQKMRPSRAYYYVFPFGHREMNRIAYFFDFDYDDNRKPGEYLEPVRQAVGRWWERSYSDNKPKLDAQFIGDDIVVTDTRDAARAPRHELTGLRATVFTSCDVASTVSALARRLEMDGREQEIQGALDSLASDGLLAVNDGHYLTLAVFRNRPVNLLSQQSHANPAVSKAPAPESLLRLV